MKRRFTLLIAMVMLLTAMATNVFASSANNNSKVSPKEWQEWFNGLSKEEQLSVNYEPASSVDKNTKTNYDSESANNSNIIFKSKIENLEHFTSREKSVELYNFNDSASNNLFGQYTDIEGNKYGPNDMCIVNDKIYILDTAKNSVIVTKNSEVERIYDLSKFNIQPYMLEVENGMIYVLDITNSKVLVIKENGSENIYDIQLENNLAVLSFGVSDGNIYITYVGEEEYTNVYALDINDSIYKSTKKLLGRYLNGYTYSFVRDSQPYENHSGTMIISNEDSLSQVKLELYSGNLLLGASFLGVDENNNLVIKTKEYNPDINQEPVQFVKKIDKLGNILSEEIEANKLEILRNTIFKDGKVYSIDNDGSYLTIASKEIVSQPLSNQIREFNIGSKDVEEISGELRYAGITRSQIMNNAKSYHTSFWWNCNNTNISPMRNYTKPRFINQGAGSYNTMPYCWGGFDSRSQFNNGLARGGRAGNINTSTSGKVYNTYGLDCSGYVSRCWGYGQKLSTRSIVNVSRQIPYSSLRQGDALNNPGHHVMLFDRFDSNGDYVLYEATLLNGYDRVSHTIRSRASVEGNYAAIRYQEL